MNGLGPAEPESDFDQFGSTYDFPRFTAPADAYIICSTGRSGSHYLGHLFFSTGMMGSPLEYFHLGHLKTWRDILKTETDVETIRGIVARRTSPSGWFGVKTHPSQFRRMIATQIPPEIFVPRHYVFIRRADIVAQAVSFTIATQTAQWISFHKEQTRPPQYDREAISKALARLQKENQEWDSLRSSLSSREKSLIIYEELMSEPKSHVEMVAKAIGILTPLQIGVPRITKQSTELNETWKERYLSGR